MFSVFSRSPKYAECRNAVRYSAGKLAQLVAVHSEIYAVFLLDYKPKLWCTCSLSNQIFPTYERKQFQKRPARFEK